MKNKVVALKQKDVPDMLKTVNQKTKELEGIEPMPTTTDGHGLQVGVKYGDIKGMDNEQALIRCYGCIMFEEQRYIEAFKEMGIKEDMPEQILCGHTIKEWKNDILARYQFVSIKRQLAKMSEAKKELEKNLSKEDKLNNSLAKIQDILTHK